MGVGKPRWQSAWTALWGQFWGGGSECTWRPGVGVISSGCVSDLVSFRFNYSYRTGYFGTIWVQCPSMILWQSKCVSKTNCHRCLCRMNGVFVLCICGSDVTSTYEGGWPNLATTCHFQYIITWVVAWILSCLPYEYCGAVSSVLVRLKQWKRFYTCICIDRVKKCLIHKTLMCVNLIANMWHRASRLIVNLFLPLFFRCSALSFIESSARIPSAAVCVSILSLFHYQRLLLPDY